MQNNIGDNMINLIKKILFIMARMVIVIPKLKKSFESDQLKIKIVLEAN